MAPSRKNTLPLAAFAPLHALVQLVPATSASASPDASSASGSKLASKSKREREREGACILLTDLEPDAWRVHVGYPDGRWLSGAWRVADVEKLASGDMSPARLGAFAQRIAHTIVQREVAIAHEEDDDVSNMKLVLGTNAKKPLRVALIELDKESAMRFAFEYFARIAEDAQAHGCRILYGDGGHTDADSDPLRQGVPHLPVKRMRTHSSINSPPPSRVTSQMSQLSHETGNTQSSLRDEDDGDDDSLPGTSRGHAQRSHDKGSGKRRPLLSQPRTQSQTQAERAAQEEVQQLKAELAKARADAAAALARASEREQTGLGGSVDRLRSRAAVQQAMPRRPGASLANPNKAARRVTAVEFASDSDDS